MLLFYELHSDFFDNKIFCFIKLVFHDNTPHLLAHWSYLSISREWANSIASYLYFKENWALIMIISLLTYYSRFMHLCLSLFVFSGINSGHPQKERPPECPGEFPSQRTSHVVTALPGQVAAVLQMGRATPRLLTSRDIRTQRWWNTLHNYLLNSADWPVLCVLYVHWPLLTRCQTQSARFERFSLRWII